jgi:parallel beta-helix repeat protein
MRWARIGGITALIVTLAIGLALSLGVWDSWTAGAQGNTFVINDVDPPEAGCTPDYTTTDINSVIALATVHDDDTLVLCQGTYQGGITVGKKITIAGQESVARNQIVIQVAAAGTDGLTINTTSTVRHLKLDGPMAPDKGIVVHSGPATISDVEVTEWGTGILVSWTSDALIQDSYISNNEPEGIVLDHASNVRIARNTIDRSANYGIAIDTADPVVVEDNTMSAGPLDHYAMHISGRSHVQVLRNNVTTRVGGTDSTGGIDLDLPADALVVIGGSDANANTFDGDMASDMYYIRLACGSEATVDATHNYWKGNPVISRGVSGVIFNDEDDDPANPGADCPGNDDGAVVFHPTSSGPAPTPTPSPTPTATGTPTPTPTATATPTATPGATRTIDLSPPGWHSLVWSGADATDPGTALACIAGKYSIAYAWEGPTTGFKRYVPGCAIPGICNMSPLNKYAAMLVNITTAATACQMPVAP